MNTLKFLAVLEFLTGLGGAVILYRHFGGEITVMVWLLLWSLEIAITRAIIVYQK